MELALVDYYIALQQDLDTPIPEKLSLMSDSSIAFEVSKLFDYISMVENVDNIFIFDVTDIRSVEKHLDNRDPSTRVSAYMTIIDYRIPRLKIATRLY